MRIEEVKRNYFIVIDSIFIASVGIFHGTGPEKHELILFTIFSAILVISVFFVRYFYLTDKKSLKQQVICICFFIIQITIFYIGVRVLTGFLLDYIIILFFTIVILLFILWEHLDFTILEKGIMILAVVVLLVVRAFDTVSTTPSTAVHLYNSELKGETSYEDLQDSLFGDYREVFTKEDFQDIELYLQQLPLKITQPALIEFEGGDILLLEAPMKDVINHLRSATSPCFRRR